MYGFRSHWYYWYTGQKKVAVMSMALSFLCLTLLLTSFFSFSAWAVLLALLLDTAGLVVIAIYLVSLRSLIPEALLTQTDALVVHYFLVPICVTFVLSRLVTFLVAKALG